MPNIGHIVDIEPDHMKAAQPTTTSNVVIIEPGSQFGSSNFL
jgi:hypothetical protein